MHRTNDDFTITTTLSSYRHDGARSRSPRTRTFVTPRRWLSRLTPAGRSLKVYTDNKCTTLFATPGVKSVGAGNVSAPSDWVKFTTPGTYYWIATKQRNVAPLTVRRRDGDGQAGSRSADARLLEEPPATDYRLAPITLGNYNVNTFGKATQVFNAMNCSTARSSMRSDARAVICWRRS